MKGIFTVILSLAFFSFCGLLPFKSHDAAELSPVETLLAEFDANEIRLTGDGGQAGVGKTWHEAVENLKNSSIGRAFLETAQKIILQGNVEDGLKILHDNTDLRPAAEIFQIDIAGDVQKLGEYLQTRTSDLTISELKAALTSGESVQPPTISDYAG